MNLLEFYRNLKTEREGAPWTQEEANRANIPPYLQAHQDYKQLPTIPPTWKTKIQREQRAAATKRIQELFNTKQLAPAIFTDIDHALLNRDTQGVIDYLILKLVDLKTLGCVVTHYDQLKDPDYYVDKRTDEEKSKDFEAGQKILYSSLRLLVDEGNQQKGNISSEALAYITDILENKEDSNVITDDMFTILKLMIPDAFYRLIVDSVTNTNEAGEQINSGDTQAGINRMQEIYTILAALSHIISKRESEIKITYGLFVELNRNMELFDGVREFFIQARRNGVNITAVTRGPSASFYFPDTKTPLKELFEDGQGQKLPGIPKVYASNLYTNCLQPVNGQKTSIHADRAHRPYSLVIDPLEKSDKLKVVFYETMCEFKKLDLTFSSDQDLLACIEQYLEYCLAITDNDLDWYCSFGQLIEIKCPRTPIRTSVDEMFGELENYRWNITTHQTSRDTGVNHAFSENSIARILNCLTNRLPLVAAYDARQANSYSLCN